jgi:hypothetical protein
MVTWSRSGSVAHAVMGTANTDAAASSKAGHGLAARDFRRWEKK